MESVSQYNKNCMLSFASLNLRFNPFGELTQNQRFHLFQGSGSQLISHFKKENTAVQIFGPSGSGKTSHLITLMGEFPDVPFFLVKEEVISPIKLSHRLIIDEFQFLSRKQRKEIFKNTTSIVFSTHIDYSREAKRAGFHVIEMFPALKHSPKRLMEIFSARIEYARRGPGLVPELSAEIVNTLMEKHGTNIRNMEFELYELFQRLEGKKRCQNVISSLD